MTKELIGGIIVGAVLVFVGTQINQAPQIETQEALIAQYYATEVATLVSPHNVRERMTHGKDDFVLVDTRTVEDYEREHIIGAVNIDSSQAPTKVVEDFQSLAETAGEKEIIIYCYSAACMNGRKVGNLLAENDIFVKEMTVGWNEWRYGWEMWNYDTEWEEYTVDDYVFAGSEPGELEVTEVPAGCDVEGELGC